MAVVGWLLLGIGFIVLTGGLVLPDRVRVPWDGLVAFLAPLGLFGALLGVLLICVPDFFEASSAGEPSSRPGAATVPPAAVQSGSAAISRPGPSPAAAGETRPTPGASP